MPVFIDAISETFANAILPDTAIAEQYPDGHLFADINSPIILAGGPFSIKVGMDKVKITKIDTGGIKGKNDWYLQNNGLLPLINGSFKLDNKLGSKNVKTASGNFILMPNEKASVTTEWKFNWLDIIKLITDALSKKKVDFGLVGRITAQNLSQNINSSAKVPISK